MKNRKLKLWLWLVGLLLLGAGLKSPTAAAQAALSLEVQIGFDSFYKINTWTPVRALVANQGADLQAQLRVLDDQTAFGASKILYVYPVDLPGQSRKEVTLYLPLRGQRQLSVELVDQAGNVLLTQQQAVTGIEENGFLVGVMASQPSLLNPLARFTTGEEARVAVAHLDLADLPTVLQAWRGLDMLVFNDVETLSLDPAQLAALQSWVRFGGRLLVGGGPNAAQTIAGLTPLLPFSTVAVQTLPHPINELQRFSATLLENRGPYVAALPLQQTASILAGDANQPLMVRAQRGLGQIYYLAFDLGLAPFDRLAGDVRFIPQIAGSLQPQQGYLSDQANPEQIRSSLGLIPDQALPSPVTVILYLVIYIIVVGPVNYLALNRLKRREWAWLTIPLIILIFSCYSYLSSFRLRGGQPLVRQITLIQSESGAPLADVTSFIGVYSPRRADYNLRLEAPALVESLPDAYGLNNELTVRAVGATTVENLRADIGGLPAIMARGQTAAPAITANLTYDRPGQRVYGTILNQTDQTISDALLVLEDQMVEVGSLAAGETQIDRMAVVHYDHYNFYGKLGYDDNGLAKTENDDPREILRLASRDTAIRALFDSYDNSNSQQHYEEMYLIGWQEGSFLDVSLTSHAGDEMNETLLFVHIPFAER